MRDMKTRKFIGAGVKNKNTKKTDYILGTNWNRKIVVYSGYGFIIDHPIDYASYVYGMDEDELWKLSEKVKKEHHLILGIKQ